MLTVYLRRFVPEEVEEKVILFADEPVVQQLQAFLRSRAVETDRLDFFLDALLLHPNATLQSLHLHGFRFRDGVFVDVAKRCDPDSSMLGHIESCGYLAQNARFYEGSNLAMWGKAIGNPEDDS